jgi:hypothetical protein
MVADVRGQEALDPAGGASWGFSAILQCHDLTGIWWQMFRGQEALDPVGGTSWGFSAALQCHDMTGKWWQMFQHKKHLDQAAVQDGDFHLIFKAMI